MSKLFIFLQFVIKVLISSSDVKDIAELNGRYLSIWIQEALEYIEWKRLKISFPVNFKKFWNNISAESPRMDALIFRIIFLSNIWENFTLNWFESTNDDHCCNVIRNLKLHQSASWILV